jgi:ubiquinone biosynthesis protein UbiJ
MNKLWLSSFSKAINAYLHLDPESEQRLRHLHHKTLAVELLPFRFLFFCQFTESGIELCTDTTEQPDTVIRGTPLQLVGVSLTKEHRHRFFADDLVIEGNAEFGQQVTSLFDHIYIDWEDYLARAVGDTPAYHISRFAQRAKKWLQRVDDSLTQNVSEYVQEEAMWLPAREELNDLFDDIDNLRMDADRMEARVNELETSLASEGSQ